MFWSQKKGVQIFGSIEQFSWNCNLRYANISPRDAQDISKICFRYIQDMAKICSRYAQDMPKIYPRYVEDMPKTCPRYAKDMSKICLRYDQDMPKICQRHANNMPKIWQTKTLTDWLSNAGASKNSQTKNWHSKKDKIKQMCLQRLGVFPTVKKSLWDNKQ